MSEHEDFHHIILNSLDALPTPFAIINVDTYDIEVANKAFGEDGSEGKKCYSVSHQREVPCNDDEHPCLIDEIRQTGEPAIVHHTHYDNLGNPRYLELHGFPVFDKQGQLKYIVEQGINITEQKRIKETLQNSDTKLRAITHSTQDAIVMMDSQGLITFWNPAAESIFGYSSDEVIGEDLHALLAPQHYHEAYREASTDFSRTGRGRAIGKTLELEAIRKDGREIIIELSLSSFRIKDEWYASGIVRDITERKKLEKLKEDVDRITRHDIKSPLNGIIGIPQILMDEPNITDTQRRYLHMITDSGRSILNMMHLSLTIYQIEQGTYEYSEEYFDILKVIERCMSEFQTLTSDKDSKIIISTNGFGEANPEKITVAGEELLAYSVVSNLVKNAVEASPNRGVVQIDITNAGTDILFSVHNKGVVPKEIRNTFFNKYTTSGKKGGTGIGTYSAKILSEAQGWSIGMKTSKEKGTTITVTIPSGESV